MQDPKIRFDFLKPWKLWMGLSTVLTVAGILAMVWNVMTPSIQFPLNRGVDFTGGIVIQGTLPGTVTTKEIHDIITPHLTKEPTVQTGAAEAGGTLLIIRTETLDDAHQAELMAAIRQARPDFESQLEESVKPAFGAELAMWGLAAVIISSIFTLIYIGFRYRFTFAFGAIASLIHDLIMVLGIYAVFRIEVNTPFIGSLLTVLGYSVNDKIVVFDRIRENLKLYRGSSLLRIANLSLNQTLVRTLNTSTVILAVFSILIFGGPTLKTFVLAMGIGFITGTYSTWFIGIPVMLLLEGALTFVKRTRAEESRVAPVASTSAAIPAPGSSGGSQSTSANGPTGESADYRRKRKKARRR